VNASFMIHLYSEAGSTKCTIMRTRGRGKMEKVGGPDPRTQQDWRHYPRTILTASKNTIGFTNQTIVTN